MGENVTKFTVLTLKQIRVTKEGAERWGKNK